MKRLIPILSLLVALLAGSVVGAPGLRAAGDRVPLAPWVEVLEDPAGTLSIDDIRQPEVAMQFTRWRGPGDPNFGFSSSTWWLRVSIAPGAGEAAPSVFPDATLANSLANSPAGSPTDWLLEVAFATLDRLTVYPSSSALPIESGDTLNFAQRPRHHRHFVFPLRIEPQIGAPTVIHLRVSSSGTLTVPLTLWRPAALHAHDQTLYAVHALYYGMLLALGLYNLLLWLALRDRVYLAYVAFVAMMATAQLALSGFGFQFVWPNQLAWQAMSLNSGFAMTGLTGAVFTRLFLDTPRHLPRLDRVITGLVIAFALSALAPLALPYRPVAIATSLIGVTFSGVAVLAGLLCLRRGETQARFFLLAWLILLLGVALMGMRNFAWLPTNVVTSNGIQIGSAIEVLLLSFALADRIHILRRDKEAAQNSALASERDRIDALEASERQLEARVSQRTRELEAVNRQLDDLAHHDPLTGLANRLLLFERLGHAIRRGKRTGERFAILLIDLDDFKQINDTLGHDAGDEVLRVSARRLVDAVRAIDTVCRLGGDEMVVLLEDTEEVGQVLTVRKKLAACLSEEIRIDRQTARVGASIGIAIWPADGDDPQALLHAADQAMYADKRRHPAGN